MTDCQPTPRLDAAAHDYAVAVFREVMRVAAAVRRGFDAGDIAAEISAEVLERPESIMSRYPDPVRYARRRVRHAGISHDRRQRVQRGEGARLYPQRDGTLQPGRPYLSGNATPADGGSEWFSTVSDPHSEFETGADEHMAATAALRWCCQGLTSTVVHELWLVDGCGYTVLEVAQLCGQRRETVSRRLNQTRRQIRLNHAALVSASGATGATPSGAGNTA